MICYIYKVTSPTGRVYIGQTTDIVERKGAYRRGDCKSQKLLYSSIKLHGWNNHTFKILEERKVGEYSKEILDVLEIYYVRLYKSNKLRYPYSNGMNLTDGGKGLKGFKHSTYTRKNLITINTGVNNGFYGKKHSPETCKLISEKNKGKTHSEEARKKISIGNKGKKLSEKEILRRVMSNGSGKSIIVYTASDPIRNNRKKTLSITKGEFVMEEFNKAAICRSLGLTQTIVSRCLNNGQLYYKGYTFEYKK